MTQKLKHYPFDAELISGDDGVAVMIVQPLGLGDEACVMLNLRQLRGLVEHFEQVAADLQSE